MRSEREREHPGKLKKVVVVGQGYVGLPLAMLASESGYQVVGIDTDLALIESLQNGVTVVEDVPAENLRSGLESGAYAPTSDYALAEDFDFAVITVPTPLKGGLPDLSHIVSATRALSEWVMPGATIVLESTTYPGTTEELLTPILREVSLLEPGEDFYVGYSPERIDPGNKVWTLLSTPKVVSGINSKSLQKVTDFYSSLGIKVVPVSGTREAEMTKLLENTFRHVNVALVNELAMFSNQLGVNLKESIAAATTKPFGFMAFWPGPGVGGHCLPIDPSYLAWAIEKQTGAEFRFVSLANTVNQAMPRYVVARAEEELHGSGEVLETAKVLLVGLAYKPNVGDLRESPALEVANVLKQRGAQVFGFDEHVTDARWPEGIERLRKVGPNDFDLTILMTHHDALDYSKVTKTAKIVLDTRGHVTGENVASL